MKALIELNKQCHKFTQIDFLKYPLWYSDVIQIDNKPVAFKQWIRKGIVCVKDLVKQENGVLSVLSFEELQNKYDFKPNFLEYFGIRNNINNLKSLFDKKNVAIH